MQLTYDEARDGVLETTDVGYTLASQDRLWTCFIFDTWSEDEWWGNRLYFISLSNRHPLSYDMWADELLWTSRKEAEEFAAKARIVLATKALQQEQDPLDPPEVYVINWGDDSRWERFYLEGRGYLERGKYRGSDAALAAMADMWRRMGARDKEG